MPDSPLTRTPADLRLFAERCLERERHGIMIGPGEATRVVAEALRLLADERERQAREKPGQP